MNNYKPHSTIEQNFIQDCNNISNYIDPNIFLSRYHKFSEDYLPLFEQDLKNIYEAIYKEFPNHEFSMKGRVKSKFSFCKKTIEKLNDYFYYDQIKDTKLRKKSENYIENILKTFPNNYELIAILKNRSITSKTKLEMIYSKLDEKLQRTLTFYLGLCDDIYASRLIVRSSGFNILKTEYISKKPYIIDSEGNLIPIEPYINIKDPKTITQIQNIVNDKPIEETRVYMNIHGKKEEIDIRNIARNPDNSLKYNIDGTLTLLRDAIQLQDGSIQNITHDNIINIQNNAYLKCENGQILNLTGLVLKKYDEPSNTKTVYDMTNYINEVFLPSQCNAKESILLVRDRYKDYIKNPKKTGYSSIHTTYLKNFYNVTTHKSQTAYSEELQTRSLRQDDETENPKSKLSHNNYKSSKDDLSQLVKNPNIELSDLFPSFILITSFPGINNQTSTTWKPSLKYSIKHFLPEIDYEQLILERASHDIDNNFDYYNEI